MVFISETFDVSCKTPRFYELWKLNETFCVYNIDVLIHNLSIRISLRVLICYPSLMKFNESGVFMSALLQMLSEHKKGRAVGICSVCSAHPLVIKATLSHAQRTGGYALIEATSNQVNQDGGYTGMQPGDFRRLVLELAEEAGLSADKVLLGGDHLGPNCWQSLPAEQAMEKSEVLIRQYVEAGFVKIHLDCSMSCDGDPVPLSDAVVAERAARLCRVAEEAWRRVDGEAPVYIVGTEVPVPGGATEDLAELEVTAPEAAAATIEAHYQSFKALGLDDVWPRVMGLVVQPGVEFDHHKVVDYNPPAAAELSRSIESYPYMLFEAHSTDYQTPQNLKRLVEDHFAILKVGPGVTFAMREALWALDAIEREWFGDSASDLRRVVLAEMEREPKYWKSYYASEGNLLLLDKQYSLSDRVRYYWSRPTVVEAMAVMEKNFREQTPPLTMISQYLPTQYSAVRSGDIAFDVESIVVHKVQEVLSQYAAACTE